MDNNIIVLYLFAVKWTMFVSTGSVKCLFLFFFFYALIKLKLQHPTVPPPGKPWASDCFLYTGRGEIWRVRPSVSGVGNLSFVRAGTVKLNRKCQFSNDLFFRAPKSPTAVNTCLDNMEVFIKGRNMFQHWTTARLSTKTLTRAFSNWASQDNNTWCILSRTRASLVEISKVCSASDQ